VTTKDEGPFRYEHPALTEALRAAQLPRRKPDEGDHVPSTWVPMTKAQRVALDLHRGKS
jgi:hypothetical protein